MYNLMNRVIAEHNKQTTTIILWSGSDTIYEKENYSICLATQQSNLPNAILVETYCTVALPRFICLLLLKKSAAPLKHSSQHCIRTGNNANIKLPDSSLPQSIQNYSSDTDPSSWMHQNDMS